MYASWGHYHMHPYFRDKLPSLDATPIPLLAEHMIMQRTNSLQISRWSHHARYSVGIIREQGCEWRRNTILVLRMKV